MGCIPLRKAVLERQVTYVTDMSHSELHSNVSLMSNQTHIVASAVRPIRLPNLQCTNPMHMHLVLLFEVKDLRTGHLMDLMFWLPLLGQNDGVLKQEHTPMVFGELNKNQVTLT